MPSLLPILSYDVPLEDGASSVLVASESSATVSTSSLLKKHTSVCQELPEKKKKAPKCSKPTKPREEPRSEPESVVTDHGGRPQAIADAVKLMKTAVYAVQMALFNGLRSDVQLRAATQVLTQAEYADVVTERSIDKKCGYPLCNNGLKVDKARKGRYHISLSQHKVYDLEETRPFCSTGCAVTSKTFGASLRLNHEEILEHEKLEEVIACVRGLSLNSQPAAKMTASAHVSGVVVVERNNENETVEFEFSTSPTSIEGYTPRKYVTTGNDGKPLKSAIKQSPRKHQRITWADEVLQPQDETFSFATGLTNGDEVPPELTNGEEVQAKPMDKERLEVAQGLADALLQAANAAEAGVVDASDAVSSAGLSILSMGVTENVAALEEITPVPAPVPDEAFEDDLSSRSAWFDAPPKGYKAEVSVFGMIWMALDEWVSTGTLAYVYNRENDTDEFRDVNGRVVRDADMSSSAEILRTMSGCISRVLPDVVQSLGVSLPISVIEQSVGRLLETMNFIQALPPFTTRNWRMITVLFLDALSVRLDALAAQLSNNRAQLRTFLRECGTGDAEYEVLKEILLPLGRLPSFSTMRGG